MFKQKMYHRGLNTWYNIALVSFLVVAVVLAGTIMSSGFNSSDATKEVLFEALDETRHGLQIVGKISGLADVSSDKILATATPISVATGGSIDLTPDFVKLNFKLIKHNSYTITYENIHAGVLTGKSYNSINQAVMDAKKLGLIDVDPFSENKKPQTTSAFVYWVIDINKDQKLDEGELAIIAIIYADKDRPSSDEYILVEGITPQGNIFTMERYIPDISDTIVDLGGKIKD